MAFIIAKLSIWWLNLGELFISYASWAIFWFTFLADEFLLDDLKNLTVQLSILMTFNQAEVLLDDFNLAEFCTGWLLSQLNSVLYDF